MNPVLAGSSSQRRLAAVKPTAMILSPLMAGVLEMRGAWAMLSRVVFDGLLVTCGALGAAREAPKVAPSAAEASCTGGRWALDHQVVATRKTSVNRLATRGNIASLGVGKFSIWESICRFDDGLKAFGARNGGCDTLIRGGVKR